MTRDVGRILGPVAAVSVGLLVAYAVVWFFFLKPDRLRSASLSMAPTIAEGERFYVDEGAEVERGDVVIFNPPTDALEGTSRCGLDADMLCNTPGDERSDVTFVKRVVAVGGDRLQLRDGRLRIDAKPVDASLPPCDEGGGSSCTFLNEIVVPRGHLYVIGDNRGASDDSRYWGPIPEDWVIGRAMNCTFPGILCSPID